MKFNLLVIAILLFSSTAQAQQEAQFVSAINNPYLYNPAAGGIGSVAQIDLVGSLQWMGANGPKSFGISGSTILNIGNSASLQEYNKNGKMMHALPVQTVGALKHVVGGKIIRDQIGIFNNTTIQANYAIHLPINKIFNIGAGIGLGWGGHRINTNRVVLYDQVDDTYSNFLSNTSGQNVFNMNAGIVFYGKGLFFGASVSQILRNEVKFNNIETGSLYQRHIYLNLSYALKVGEHVLEPVVIAKVGQSFPTSLDYGARFLFRGASWIGIYGRSTNTMIFQVGSTLVGNTYLSYSYGMGMGQLKNVYTNSHEIQLGIYFGNKSAKAKSATKKNKEQETEG